MGLTLDRLPTELILDLYSFLTLPQLLTLSACSRRYHNILKQSNAAWVYPVQHALTALPGSEESKVLAGLAGRSQAPSEGAIWSTILCTAEREFIARDLELPRLRSADWENIFKRRELLGFMSARRIHF